MFEAHGISAASAFYFAGEWGKVMAAFTSSSFFTRLNCFLGCFKYILFNEPFVVAFKFYILGFLCSFFFAGLHGIIFAGYKSAQINFILDNCGNL